MPRPDDDDSESERMLPSMATEKQIDVTMNVDPEVGASSRRTWY
jgi:hypothetical protein